jgi:hypothetical protein
MKQLRTYLLAAVTATAVVAALPGAVAAAKPDGAYARFSPSSDGVGGLVLLSYTGATTVNAGVLDLIASAQYHLRGSSQGCAKMPSDSNRVFGVKGTTDDHGTLWLRRSPAINAVVHSLWLDDGSNPPICASSLNFDRMDVNVVGDRNGDALIGIWDKEHVLSLLERRQDNRARLSIVIDLGSGDDEITVRGVDTSCGKRPTQRFFDLGAELAAKGAFMSKTISITPDEIGMIRSERVVFETHRECANIIGVLVA